MLSSDYLPEIAGDWSGKLGISPRAVLSALFGGADEQVLIGAVSGPEWWRLVAGRLGVGPEVIDELRRDMARRETWDEALIALLRRMRGHVRVALVSNAWPDTRVSLAEAGLLDIADEVVLSCDVGYLKPDARIYQVALRRLAAEPADALFIDDQPENVAAALSLGMTAHLHTSSEGTIATIRAFAPPES